MELSDEIGSRLMKLNINERTPYVYGLLSDNGYWNNATESTDETIEETQSRIASWQSRRGENDEDRPFT